MNNYIRNLDIHIYGFLDRNNQKEREILESEYSEPQEAGAQEFAIEISNLIKDETRMDLMKKCARKKYECNLNWTLFGEKIKHIIDML